MVVGKRRFGLTYRLLLQGSSSRNKGKRMYEISQASSCFTPKWVDTWGRPTGNMHDLVGCSHELRLFLNDQCGICSASALYKGIQNVYKHVRHTADSYERVCGSLFVFCRMRKMVQRWKIDCCFELCWIPLRFRKGHYNYSHFKNVQKASKQFVRA